MLSKTLKEINNHDIPENEKTKTSWTGTSDVNGKGTIFFYLQYSRGIYGNLTVNDKNYGSATAYSGDTGKRENVSLKVGDIVKITWTGYDSLVSMSVKISYKENSKSKLGKIYDLKGIGEKATNILFGVLPDGTRRD